LLLTRFVEAGRGASFTIETDGALPVEALLGMAVAADCDRDASIGMEPAGMELLDELKQPNAVDVVAAAVEEGGCTAAGALAAEAI
jgi:hypothetical protein